MACIRCGEKDAILRGAKICYSCMDAWKEARNLSCNAIEKKVRPDESYEPRNI